MTLPFGTKVSLNGHPEYIGVVIDLGASAAESYVVAWHHHKTNPLRPWYFRPELTVVESPDTIELRRIRVALTRLIRSFEDDDTRSLGTIDGYVQPIADAVIARHKRQLAALSEKT
jgi:hypothetical protein